MDNKKLKLIRNSIGVSIATAAKQVHIAPRSWARYESGERKIPDGVVELFCIKNNLDYGETDD